MGDILLVDRYHCTYFTVAMLSEHGVDILTRQQHRASPIFVRANIWGIATS